LSVIWPEACSRFSPPLPVDESFAPELTFMVQAWRFTSPAPPLAWTFPLRFRVWAVSWRKPPPFMLVESSPLTSNATVIVPPA
jgi:hypothetical protein